jgi:hypothetical protein
VALGVTPPADAAGDAVAAFGQDVLGRAAPGADADAGSTATGR